MVAQKRDLGAAALLVASAFLYHLPALTQGLTPNQDDVETFFFPALVATADALHHATLRLWTPLIFGGYPLFADGEAGMLYPLNLLVLPWATPEQAMVILPFVHSLLASAFTFYLLRTLEVGRLGATAGALVYAYSAFAAGQSVHADVTRSIVWLPLELAFAQRMCGGAGPARLRYAVLAGGAFGIQALALHVHISLLSALAVTAFVGYRWISRTRFPLPFPGEWGQGEGIPNWLREGLRLALGLAILGGLGVGLAAVQLLPLGEMATQTYRGAGLPSSFSAPNSVWPGNLLTLLLPHLYDVGAFDYWGPWVKWETVLYVGVLPLLLAAIGLFRSGGRYRLFFGLLIAGAVLCAFGSYGPLPLWDALHQLPGFNVLKSPGRFSLLLALGVAVAAGYGVESLENSTPAWRGALTLLIGAVLATGLGVAVLSVASDKLHAWSATDSILVEHYLRLPGVPRFVEGERLTYDRAAAYAAEALSPANPRTAAQLGLALASGLTLSLWLGARVLRPLAVTLTIALVFADLWVVGLTFHPTIPIDELRSRAPDFLRPTTGSLFRVLTIPVEGEKVTQVDPNRLIPLGIPEASGYSSLPPDRPNSYLTSFLQTDDDLLNLWNVRYILRQRRAEPQPGYEGVSFHPTRPLLRGKIGERDHPVIFLPEGGPATGDEVRIVAALADAQSVLDGAQVARLTLEATDGATRALSLVAGRDVSDATIGVPGATGFAHRQTEVAFDHQRSNPDGERFGHQIFYGRLPIGTSIVLRRLTVEPTLVTVRLHVFGLGLYDSVANDVTQIWDREDRPIVYADSQITVSENRSYLPRAFLVGQTEVLPPGADPLLRIREGPFIPERTALIEAPVPDGVVLPGDGPPGIVDLPGKADIEEYRDERVVVRTRSNVRAVLLLQDAYFPGWAARIDGQLTPLLRADYLFRAVAVPAGEHLVTFSYEPAAVGLGLVITLVSALALLVVLGGGLVGRHRSPIRRSSSSTQPGSPGPS